MQDHSPTKATDSNRHSSRWVVLGRVGNASVAMLFAQVINMASNLLLVPLFLLVWSVQLYGEWVTLTALVAYLSTMDMGVGLYGVNKLTQAYARKEIREYRRYQSTFLAFYLTGAVLGTILLAFAAWTLPFANWFDIKEAPNNEIPVIITLLGIQVLWRIPQSLVISIYRTTGDLAKTQWITNFQQLLTLGIIAWGLIQGGNMLQLAFLQLVPIAVVTISVLIHLHYRMGEFFPTLREASWSVFTKVLKPSLLFAVFVLTTPLVFQGTVLLVSAVLGALAVVIFTTTRTLVNVVRQVIATISYAIWPEFTIMEVQGDVGKLVRAFYLTVTLTIVLGIGFSTALWFEGVDVIEVWTRRQLQPDSLLLRVFLVETTLLVIIGAVGLPSVASNRHKVNSLAALAGSISGVVLAALLIKPFGLVGVPLGLLAGEILCIYHFVVSDACRNLGLSYVSFSLYLWSGILFVSLGSLCIGWLAHRFFTESDVFFFVRWITVGFSTMTSAVLLGAAMFAIQHRASQVGASSNYK